MAGGRIHRQTFKDIDVVIYDDVITAMSQPGGMVWRWALQKSQRTKTTAKALCPVQTGRLRASITSFYEGATRDQVHVGVSAGGPGAPYAKFVIKGTKNLAVFGRAGESQGRIYPQWGKALHMPADSNGSRFRAWSKGQAPNPFLQEALEIVMATL
jgi:hypothetical protein